MTPFQALLLILAAVAAIAQQTTFRSFGPAPDGQKYVALTFDDGPHAVLTPRLLDRVAALKASKNISAHLTFYVMGVKAVLHPHILKRAVSEGHEVANHVWNHPVLAKTPWKDVRSQLFYTSEAIFNATGKYPTTMRPPYGKTYTPMNNRIWKETHLPVVYWSLDTLDWKRPPTAEIVSQAVQRSTPGTIVLCHDIHPNTVDAVPEIIEQLTQRGYLFRTVTELIRMFYPNSLAASTAPPKGFQSER